MLRAKCGRLLRWVGFASILSAISLTAFAEPVLFSAKDGYGYVVDSTDSYAAADNYCKWFGYDFASSYLDIDHCQTAANCQYTKGWKSIGTGFFFSTQVSRYFTQVNCALDPATPPEKPSSGQKAFAKILVKVTDGRNFAIGGSDAGGAALHFCIQQGYASLVNYEKEPTCSVGDCAYKPGFIWAEGRWRYVERLATLISNVKCSNP
jgi:hypothetical protein